MKPFRSNPDADRSIVTHLSLKLLGELVANPVSAQPTLRGEPTWEIAQLFPSQGDWTEADYFELKTRRLVELSNGRLEFLPMPTNAHQVIVALLYRLLFAFLEKNDPAGSVLFAPVWIRLWPGTIREPDVVYMRGDHQSRVHDHWDGADLVMEVVSPSNSRHDRNTKRIEYAQAGIPEYWLIDPLEREIIIFKLNEANNEYYEVGLYSAGKVATSVFLPGFEISVDHILNTYDTARKG
jgi:Uma2 family endonuclease